MARMFVEDFIAEGESQRAAAARLMAHLDTEAAKEGHRVVGDVTVMEFTHTLGARSLRLEADVAVAV